MSLFNYEEEDREREAAKAKGPGYTSEPCIHCKRIRVYERNDGQFIGVYAVDAHNPLGGA